jgi:hypothetical protein
MPPLWVTRQKLRGGAGPSFRLKLIYLGFESEGFMRIRLDIV